MRAPLSGFPANVHGSTNALPQEGRLPGNLELCGPKSVVINECLDYRAVKKQANLDGGWGMRLRVLSSFRVQLCTTQLRDDGLTVKFYFDRDNQSSYQLSSFGLQMSQGCVNMCISDASWRDNQPASAVAKSLRSSPI